MRTIHAARGILAAALSASLASCGPDAADGGSDRAAEARGRRTSAGCDASASDSARVVCAALDTVAALTGMPARLLDMTRDGDRLCVRTAPVRADVLDGEGAVAFDRSGTIVGVLVSDSVACPAPPTTRPPRMP